MSLLPCSVPAMDEKNLHGEDGRPVKSIYDGSPSSKRSATPFLSSARGHSLNLARQKATLSVAVPSFFVYGRYIFV